MYNMYRGQDFIGAGKQCYEFQARKEQQILNQQSQELESKKIYVAPGVYKFLPTPSWARQSVISFK